MLRPSVSSLVDSMDSRVIGNKKLDKIIKRENINNLPIEKVDKDTNLLLENSSRTYLKHLFPDKHNNTNKDYDGQRRFQSISTSG